MEKTVDRLAKAYIEVAVSELKHKYIDFLYPLSVMEWKEQPEEAGNGLSTDGIAIYYNPDWVLRCGKNILQYNVMHIILHGLLGHFQVKDEYPKKDYRDLCMDVQVGHLMSRLNLYPTLNRARALERIWGDDYSMGQYYQLPKIREIVVRLEYYKNICRVDNHEIWDKQKEEVDKRRMTVFWKEVQNVVLGEEPDMGRLARVAPVGTETDTAEETFAVGKYGAQNYRDLFEQLFHVREVSMEDADTIDAMFYHYGLELYENVPLIEPLESFEKPSFHTLVLAVDVSGSCVNEETAERFWGETYRCISQLKEQYTDGKVLLLQCDSEIQKEEMIELAEFIEFPKLVEVRGMGGTSFVPVFRRIEELEKEGMTIEALLYFTDGEGEYPQNEPEYPVYFVITDTCEESGWCPQMPEWIRRVVLENLDV